MQCLFKCVSLSLIAAVAASTHVLKELTSRPKLVLGLDGTIYSTMHEFHRHLEDINRQYLMECFASCFAENQQAAISDNYVRDFHPLLVGMTCNSDQSLGGYDEYVKQRVDYESLKTSDKLIDCLQNSNADIIVFTELGLLHAQQVLFRLGIQGFVHQIVYRDFANTEACAKPEQEAYQQLQKSLAVETKNMYFVDADLKSAEIAQSLGWNILQVQNVDGQDSHSASIPWAKSIRQAFPNIF
ncbi:putative pyrimidine 5-nucleotidase protein [Paramicrosporidium saccamoebae]|uniref:Putative pyrimidine 5-nucleotidase protein n=1 Tax=Paramicrosporidium saccamoebae TaxID=1246581 RepID=A0A2H9TJ28_9FUNG|nr:putative pyrimidine 5-nucleotidase protein [Paramicrosporidium saccamoebae]